MAHQIAVFPFHSHFSSSPSQHSSFSLPFNPSEFPSLSLHGGLLLPFQSPTISLSSPPPLAVFFFFFVLPLPSHSSVSTACVCLSPNFIQRSRAGQNVAGQKTLRCDWKRAKQLTKGDKLTNTVAGRAGRQWPHSIFFLFLLVLPFTSHNSFAESFCTLWTFCRASNETKQGKEGNKRRKTSWSWKMSKGYGQQINIIYQRHRVH